MKRETLEKQTLPRLHDLLVESTIHLLDAIEKKADGITLRDLKKNVELLQEIVKRRRADEDS
jgi:hypothetical protein